MWQTKLGKSVVVSALILLAFLMQYIKSYEVKQQGTNYEERGLGVGCDCGCVTVNISCPTVQALCS